MKRQIHFRQIQFRTLFLHTFAVCCFACQWANSQVVDDPFAPSTSAATQKPQDVATETKDRTAGQQNAQTQDPQPTSEQTFSILEKPFDQSPAKPVPQPELEPPQTSDRAAEGVPAAALPDRSKDLAAGSFDSIANDMRPSDSRIGTDAARAVESPAPPASDFSPLPNPAINRSSHASPQAAPQMSAPQPVQKPQSIQPPSRNRPLRDQQPTASTDQQPAENKDAEAEADDPRRRLLDRDRRLSRPGERTGIFNRDTNRWDFYPYQQQARQQQDQRAESQREPRFFVPRQRGGRSGLIIRIR